MLDEKFPPLLDYALSEPLHIDFSITGEKNPFVTSLKWKCSERGTSKRAVPNDCARFTALGQAQVLSLLT
jgi:hypothetical protein